MKFRTLAIASAASILAMSLSACGGGDAEEIMVNTADQDTQQKLLDNRGPEMKPQASVGAGGLITAGLSPAAIRQRYGFANLTSPAQQGSGQIITIISAYNNPNAAADLNKFSAMHGLPQCRVVQTQLAMGSGGRAQVVNTPTAAPGDGCEFQIINVDSFGRPAAHMVNGKLQEVVYGNDRTWATESTMDIQWAHAMAPMAKIVLIQVASPFAGALSFGVNFASKFSNVVSMSWGQFETGFEVACPTNNKFGKTVLRDPTCTPTKMAIAALTNPASNGSAGGWDTVAFSNPNVTYVAASGDFGARPMWPAVSNKVLAVGGTTARGSVDTGWNLSGGGISTVYDSPSWQKSLGAKRNVPDIAMVGDSSTAVSVYITPSPMQPDTACVQKSGAAACGWYKGYGTSVGAPIIAGMVAVSNSMRVEQKKTPLNFTSSLYSAASIPAQYSVAFNDVTVGNNGYAAGVGYDLVTGLGTPNAEPLLKILTGY